MPVKACSADGKPGYQWGDAGKCYTYSEGDEAGRKRAKQKAYLQGAAIGKDAGSEHPERDILIAKLQDGDFEVLTPVERASAVKIGKHLGYISPDDAAASELSKVRPGSAMVAWRVPQELAARLAVPGGEFAGDLHMTLAYFEPEAGELAVDADLLAAAMKVMTAYTWELSGEISGLGRFVNGPDSDVFYASVDMPGLEDLRMRVKDAAMNAGLYCNGEHGFTPHISLMYMDKDMPDPGSLAGPIPVSMSSLAVVTSQGDYAEFPLRENEEMYDEASKRAPLPEEPKEAALGECSNCGGSIAARTGFCPHCEMRLTKSDLVYSPVMKARDEMRYTMGPLYAPDRLDAHDEYAEDEELHEAVIEYSLANDRRMRLMHDTSIETGTWVELMRWPYEHTIELQLDGETVKQKMPAGTVYMGVIWDEEYWPLVKSGKIGGLSLGGRAVRMAGDKDAPKKEMGHQKEPRE